MPKKRDYYEILGVSKTATEDEIKKAYRKLAKKYHPDVSKEENTEELFKEATEAAEVLLDEQKRKTYDQFGHDGVQGMGAGFGGGFSGFSDFFSNMGGGNDFFSDIFSNIFGRGSHSSGFSSRSSKKARGQDVVVDLTLTLNELLFGIDKEVELQLVCKCDECNGVGAQSSSDIITCEVCNGHGVVTILQDMGIAKFQTQQTCPKCKGKGKSIKNPCKSCKGEGARLKREKIKLPIPKGLTPGQQIVLRNVGNYSVEGGEKGHLYANIDLSVTGDIKIVNNYDIKAKLNVSYLDALLGNTIKVDSLDGQLDVKIAKGSKNFDTLILKNHGLFKGVKSSSRGNLILEINIVIPKEVSKEEKELLEDIQKISQFKSSNNIKN